MRTFLQEVAHDLFGKCNGDFSKVAIVFPNKRAGLFFNDYLAKESTRPMWAPVYLSISDLMQDLSSLEIGDPIQLVCMLYKVYVENTGSKEKLDSFYPWGQIMISDFDDVDKNLVDADKLFDNLNRLYEIKSDLSEFLDVEQIKALEQFFANFSMERTTELKKKFLKLWDRLNGIYHDYKEVLQTNGIAYEGMLYRSVVEKVTADDMPYEKYVFVGFNVLNKVEKKFFERLKDAGKALFYWDYDVYYTNDNNGASARYEAGEFIRQDILAFGNELGKEYFNHLNAKKDIRLISSSTENAQARYVSKWVKETVRGDGKENAVVLCNESLLLPVVHSIPDSVQNVNITMGFPLSQTPIYSFISAVMELQTKGYHKDAGHYAYEYVRVVLSHLYTQQMCAEANEILRTILGKGMGNVPLSQLQVDDFLTVLFTPVSDNRALCRQLMELIRRISNTYKEKKESDMLYIQLYKESLYQTFVIVNRMLSLVDLGDLNVEAGTFVGLLNGIFCSKSIPFHGEPIVGLQVMGVLETRNLDFRNILLLSLNEGQLPKTSKDISLVPYNLRKAFGMTTVEHKNAVYAYYFYRLIQRAEQVTMVYNSTSDGLVKGEMSRFMLQLLVEWNHPIAKEVLDTNQRPAENVGLSEIKTDEIMAELHARYDLNVNEKAHSLSPSALNMYVDCPMQFYLSCVAGLNIPDDINMEIEANTFGDIFHYTAQQLYNDLTAIDPVVHAEDIDRVLKNKVYLRDKIDEAFKKKFFHIEKEEKAAYNGTQLINFEVIESYVIQMLKFDKRYTPFKSIAREKPVRDCVSVDTKEGTVRIKIGGYIDRMDEKDGTIRIVDYKTGKEKNALGSITESYDPSNECHGPVSQIFLYSWLVAKNNPNVKIKPVLLYLRQSNSEDYSADVLVEKEVVDDFCRYCDLFYKELEDVIARIFDKDIPFSKANNDKICDFCPFAGICSQ